MWIGQVVVLMTLDRQPDTSKVGVITNVSYSYLRYSSTITCPLKREVSLWSIILGEVSEN